MISLWLVSFAVLILYPFAASLYWSFCRYDLLGEPRWVGLDNYYRLAGELISGGPFARALGNTAYYALVSVALSVVLGIALAVLLSSHCSPMPGCRRPSPQNSGTHRSLQPSPLLVLPSSQPSPA